MNMRSKCKSIFEVRGQTQKLPAAEMNPGEQEEQAEMEEAPVDGVKCQVFFEMSPGNETRAPAATETCKAYMHTRTRVYTQK